MPVFSEKLPDELFSTLKKLGNEKELLQKMTTAGGKVVEKNIKSNVPIPAMANCVKRTNPYNTPSDRSTNVKVYVSGYLPFSTPGRKTFSRRNKKGGKIYTTDKGVPASFLANVFEHGRTGAPFPKKPFVRPALANSGPIKEAIQECVGNIIGKPGETRSFDWSAL